MLITILRLTKVIERTGLARSTIYLKIANKEFPTAISLSENGRAVGWIEADIQAWIDSRIAASKMA